MSPSSAVLEKNYRERLTGTQQIVDPIFDQPKSRNVSILASQMFVVDGESHSSVATVEPGSVLYAYGKDNQVIVVGVRFGHHTKWHLIVI
jgi:hypothetical protein